MQKMLDNMDRERYQIQLADVPYCPYCGGVMETNLRKDARFAEMEHFRQQPAYEVFLRNSARGLLELLELGVGFNTPGIIRFPFEKIAFVVGADIAVVLEALVAG